MESNREFNWLIAHPEIEVQYAGEYIAISGDQVIAHGKDLLKIFMELANLKVKAVIHKVMPQDRELVV